MNVSKTAAVQKLTEYYKKVKQLASLTNGELKHGMVSILANYIGKIKNLKDEDLEVMIGMTEDEWIDYGKEKFYYSTFNRKPRAKVKAIAQVETVVGRDYTDLIKQLQESVINLGKVQVTINQKLEMLVGLQKDMLTCWKGEQQ